MRGTILASIILLIAGLVGPAVAGPPNVVIILGDDQAWGDFGFMGHPVVRTPSLDRLAAQGLTFTRGYVPSSLCRPSLASLVTGLYPHQHRITSNDPSRKLPKPEFPGPETADDRQTSTACPRYRKLLAQRGYKEPSNRQVVGGALQSRRVHARHDAR